jgi:hypothetical protein
MWAPEKYLPTNAAYKVSMVLTLKMEAPVPQSRWYLSKYYGMWQLRRRQYVHFLRPDIFNSVHRFNEN